MFMTAAPAHAWFAWLDGLSGPGPFFGPQYDYQFLCWMQQASPEAARQAFETVQQRLANSTAPQLAQRVPQLSVPPAQNAGGRQQLLAAARAADGFTDELTKGLSTTAEDLQAKKSWEDARRKVHDAALPRFSTPVVGFWGSCTDRLRSDVILAPDAANPQGDRPRYRHVEGEYRHPLLAFAINFRDLSNASAFHFWSEVGRNSEYAGGSTIHLRIVEPKVSIPIWIPGVPALALVREIADYQAGIGFYHFSSAGFRTGAKSFHGAMFEPFRLDLHVPARLVDWANEDEHQHHRVWRRLLTVVSVAYGKMDFLGGIPGENFVSDSGGKIHDVPASEFVNEIGVVINIGRLVGF